MVWVCWVRPRLSEKAESTLKDTHLLVSETVILKKKIPKIVCLIICIICLIICIINQFNSVSFYTVCLLTGCTVFFRTIQFPFLMARQCASPAAESLRKLRVIPTGHSFSPHCLIITLKFYPSCANLPELHTCCCCCTIIAMSVCTKHKCWKVNYAKSSHGNAGFISGKGDGRIQFNAGNSSPTIWNHTSP